MSTVANFLKKLISYESNPKKLAFACAIGAYIAFSPYPFPFGHTALVFLFSWLLSLNLSVVWLVSVTINNPWTMIPVYGSDYAFGYWLVHKCLGIVPTNPGWMSYFNNFLTNTLGLPGFCLWSFLIGGNLLGILVGVMLYPIVLPLFNRLIAAQLQES